MIRPRFILPAITTTVVVALIAVLIFERRAAPPPEPLVIAIANALLSTPILVAEQQGFFADEGLQVTLQRHAVGKQALEAVIRGEAEVATVAETPIVFASLQGASFSVIANFAFSSRHLLVARADRGIRQVTDLRGRRIGVSVGTTAHYFLHVLLSDEGLQETDVELVPLVGPEQAAELAAGRVDAVASFPPYSSACRQILGEAAIIFSSDIRYTGFSSLVAAREFSHRRTEAALRLLRAMDQAITWMNHHRQPAIHFAAQALNMDNAMVEQSWDDLQMAMGLYQSFIVLLEAESRWAIETSQASTTAMPNYLDYIDSSLLEQLRPEAVTVIQKP